jgi:hypothetical protein
LLAQGFRHRSLGFAASLAVGLLAEMFFYEGTVLEAVHGVADAPDTPEPVRQAARRSVEALRRGRRGIRCRGTGVCGKRVTV